MDNEKLKLLCQLTYHYFWLGEHEWLLSPGYWDDSKDPEPVGWSAKIEAVRHEHDMEHGKAKAKWDAKYPDEPIEYRGSAKDFVQNLEGIHPLFNDHDGTVFCFLVKDEELSKKRFGLTIQDLDFQIRMETNPHKNGILTQFDDDYLYELYKPEVEFSIKTEDGKFIASFPTGSHWQSEPFDYVSQACKACKEYAKTSIDF